MLILKQTDKNSKMLILTFSLCRIHVKYCFYLFYLFIVFVGGAWHISTCRCSVIVEKQQFHLYSSISTDIRRLLYKHSIFLMFHICLIFS